MRVSRKARYGLRAMSLLASAHGKAPLAVRAVSRAEGISAHYLSRILGELRRAGLVRSVRGRGGGFVLNRPPSAISVLEIFRALGENTSPVSCAGGNPAPCERAAECPVQPFWADLGRVIDGTLEHTTLAELSRPRTRRGGRGG
jgi:Rrf2 family protein